MSLAGAVFATVVLGHVKVETPKGPPNVHTNTIVSLAKLDPGEPLTFEKLQRAEKELNSTNLFSNVHVELLMPPDEAARLMYFEPGSTTRADVEITLEEKRFWYAFPYGSASTDNWDAGAVFADVNMLGRAKTLFATADYGNRTKQAFVLYRDPMILGSRFVGFDVSSLGRDDHTPIYQDRKTVANILVQQYGGAALIRLNWHRDFSTMFQYGLDHYDIAMDLPSGLDSYIRGELRYDSRLAEEGLYHGAMSRLWVEFSDDRLGSNFSYTREMMQAGGWWNWKKLNFGIRGEAGVEYATGTGGIPFPKEFTLGGSDLRGYLKREFRGDTTAHVQNEMIFPLFKIWQLKIRGDVFYDAGLVYHRDAGFTSNDFHQGVGGGIRFFFKQLAIPVVGVDVGYGIEDKAIGYYFAFGLPES
jgi:outer membrane protein assembly factor BamA